MEALTRLVTDSLARHGLDRPVDPRRLQWSRWFRCDSPHSLLVVPSKPGIFALAEEVAALGGAPEPRGRNPERSEGTPAVASRVGDEILGGAALQPCDTRSPAALAAEITSRRMLAVLQFSEDDNMAFVLDRMFTYANPMRSRLHSGNCFVRFVVVEDQEQRRSICAALNQWVRTSAEKASGLPAGFSSSLELAWENVARAPSPVSRPADARVDAAGPKTLPSFAGSRPDSGANKNLHCPHPLPSGF
jgi:hypothetical protein